LFSKRLKLMAAGMILLAFMAIIPAYAQEIPVPDNINQGVPEINPQTGAC